MTNWHAEIVELHEVFEAFFLGLTDSLERVEAVLADDFTIVGPHGTAASRAETMKGLQDAHAHTDSLVISISDPRLLCETADGLVASYVESHELANAENHRLSTVVFTANDAAPNGVVWRRVHETWIP